MGIEAESVSGEEYIVLCSGDSLCGRQYVKEAEFDFIIFCAIYIITWQTRSHLWGVDNKQCCYLMIKRKNTYVLECLL